MIPNPFVSMHQASALTDSAGSTRGQIVGQYYTFGYQWQPAGPLVLGGGALA